jgi:voltage-gated potassium channel
MLQSLAIFSELTLRIHFKRFVPNNYSSLLVSLLLLVLFTPFANATGGGHIAVSLAVVYLTISAALVIAPNKIASMKVMAIAAVGSLLWTCSKSIPFEPFHTTIFQCIANGTIILFLGTTAWLMLKHILFTDADHNTICGAICVYLLIGVVFALLFLTCVEVSPTSISFEHLVKDTADERERLSQLIYFSMCCLTTLGLGDIIPAARFTRTLTWLEAVTGQLYLAILVARLVGLQIAFSLRQRSTGANEESEPSEDTRN